MKKSTDIIGLPVIGIAEGTELGTVKDMVINASTGSLAALIVDDGKWYLGAKLLPFATVAGIGETVVTTESSRNIVPVSAVPELEKLLAANVKVVGTKVLAKSGRIIGTVIEVIFDASGKIAACEIEDAGGKVTQFPAQRVITYGPQVTVVAEIDERVPEPANAGTKLAGAREEVVVQEPPAVSATAQAPAMDEEIAKKFDERQRKFLLGKKASRRIETDSGLLIVEQGGEITEEVLQKAKLAGKFVELSMSIQ